MDNLQHIDELLRQASQVPANALVNASDWAAIETKLRRRKNRIYAMWFFLALVSVNCLGILYQVTTHNQTDTSTIVEIESQLPFEDRTEAQQPISPRLNSKDPIVSNNSKVHSALPNKITSGIHSSVPRDTPFRKFYSQLDDETTIAKEIVNKEYTNNVDLILAESKQVLPLFSSYTPRSTAMQLVNPEDLVNLLLTAENSTKTSATMDAHIPSRHWEVGVSFTPGLSSKLTSENSTLSGLINRSYYDKVASSETSSFANTFGFNVQYHTNKWFVASGLFATQRSEQINYDYQITEFTTVNDNTNTIDDYTPLDPLAFVSINHSGSNSYHFIEIPLNIGYKTSISPNFEIRTQVGLSYLSLLSRQGKKGDYTTLELQDLTELQFNTHNIAANIKTGVYFNKQRFAVGLEPIFGVNLNSLRSSETSAIKTRPYGYGINITSAIKLFKL